MISPVILMTVRRRKNSLSPVYKDEECYVREKNLVVGITQCAQDV